jgi:multidrug resistance efflux pump
MNAALESGVAGVGEMAPARQPARARQMVVAVALAVVALVAGVLTYRSLASSPTSFGGQIVPTRVFPLGFGATGAVTAVYVKAGQHVTAGQVLATQDDSLAQASLQEANDSEAAAAAALYVDQHPQQSGLMVEQDAVASAQDELNSVTTQAANTASSDSATVSERQQDVIAAQAAFSGQCTSASQSSTCQSLAAKLSAAQTSLTQAQRTATADQESDQQRVESAQSLLGERQAALAQAQAQGNGQTVTLDEAQQRLAAAKVAVAQDQATVKATRIVAPASGMVGAVSVTAGENITDNNLRTALVTVDSGPLVVSARLPGTEIGVVRVGQAVTLDIEPLNQRVPGRILQVSQVASQSQSAVGYTVLCQIEASNPALLAGMTVSITPK